jgi:hypothetical protein
MAKDKKKELLRSKVYYYGITIGDKFFSRYEEDDMFDRGFGELWLTRQTLFFRRYLSLKPFEIPTKAIFKLSFGHGHAGKIAISPIMKIHWRKDDQELVFGFSAPKNVTDLMRWQKKLVTYSKAKF